MSRPDGQSPLLTRREALVMLGAAAFGAAGALSLSPDIASASPDPASTSQAAPDITVARVPSLAKYNDFGQELVRHPKNDLAARELALYAKFPQPIVEQADSLVQEQPQLKGWSISYFIGSEKTYLIPDTTGNLSRHQFKSTRPKLAIVHIGPDILSSNKNFVGETGIKFSGVSDEIGIDLRWEENPPMEPHLTKAPPSILRVTLKHSIPELGKYIEEYPKAIRGYDPKEPAVLLLGYHNQLLADDMEFYNNRLAILQTDSSGDSHA